MNTSSIDEATGTALLTVTRNNTDLSSAIVVNFTNSDATELAVPPSVTIPAGQASLSVSITAVDDTLLDGSQNVSITAVASGYVGASMDLAVTDVETLTLTFVASSISEFGGATSGTITRSNTDNGSALVINLLSSDPSEITVPTSVIIPAGLSSVTFDVVAVDDALLDGSQSVILTGTATGYVGGIQALEVTDYEALLLTLSQTQISENGGSSLATLTRPNSDNAAPWTINLSSSDPTEATVPTTLTIPAGQASVTFNVTAKMILCSMARRMCKLLLLQTVTSPPLTRST